MLIAPALKVRPLKGRIMLSIGKIAIQQISVDKANYANH